MSNTISQMNPVRDILMNPQSRSTEAAAKRPGGDALPVGGEIKPHDMQGIAAKADVSNAVRRLRDYVQDMRRELHFSIDEESGYTVIRVIDPVSKEVIRQIPQEEILALARDIKEDKDRVRLLRAQA